MVQTLEVTVIIALGGLEHIHRKANNAHTNYEWARSSDSSNSHWI